MTLIFYKSLFRKGEVVSMLLRMNILPVVPNEYAVKFIDESLFHAELNLHQVRVACGIFFCIFFTRTCVDVCVTRAPSNTRRLLKF